MVSDCFSKRTANNKSSSKLHVAQNKTAGSAPPFCFVFARRYQRRSCSTLACDWLASASAETAIDWRVDSAWLLAASSLVSASVRLDEPVCSTLMRLFEKSWRTSTIERFEPSDDPSERSVLDAAFRTVRTLLVAPLSMKSRPCVKLLSPRPAE